MVVIVCVRACPPPHPLFTAEGVEGEAGRDSGLWQAGGGPLGGGVTPPGAQGPLSLTHSRCGPLHRARLSPSSSAEAAAVDSSIVEEAPRTPETLGTLAPACS